jgi:thiamine transport system substrate-binding protein
MNMLFKLALVLVSLAMSACVVATPIPQPGTLTVMVHDSFSISEPVLKAFEQTHNVKVNVLKSGDAGSMLNKAILSKDAPLADVIYGIDNTFMTRALNAGILDAYQSAALSRVPARLKLDPAFQLTPVNYGYVSLNLDKTAAQLKGLTTPKSLRDLTGPAYNHNVIVQNAATSSPGLAFLLMTIAAFPEGSDYPWQQYWREMTRNMVHVSPDWNDAYYIQFSGSSGKGPHNVVVSYQTSPAAEVFFSEGRLSAPPTTNLDIGAFEQVEFVGVLKGAKNPAMARTFIDYMLSPAFQADIPTQMFVYPAVEGTPLPDVFVKFAAPPTMIFSLPPAQIEANRERWITEWTRLIAGG